MKESSCSLARRLDCSRACSEVMAAVLMAAAVLWCVCVCVCMCVRVYIVCVCSVVCVSE